jgi:hypothetical protein
MDNTTAVIISLRLIVVRLQKEINQLKIRLEAVESATIPTGDELLARRYQNERLKHSHEHEGQAVSDD